MLALAVQKDMHPTGDQKGAGWILSPGSGNIPSWRLIMKYFFMVILSLSADSRKAVVSFWQKDVQMFWLTTLRTKSFQEKCG